MKAMSLSLALGLSLVAAVQAAERPQDYTHHYPLTLQDEGPWYRLEVPMAVHYAAQHGDLRDVRIFNAQGQAQAYAVLPGQAQSHEQLREQAVRWFALHADAQPHGVPQLRVQRSTDGTLIELSDEPSAPAGRQLRGWLLDGSRIDAPLVRLELSWSGAEQGFQRFSIEASDDLQQWRSWGQGQVASLSFADQRIEQRQVELPGQSARYLRLLWLSPQQAPALEAAVLHSRHQADSPAPVLWSEKVAAQALDDGRYQWQLPQALPLERLRIHLDEPNTLAPVWLEGRTREQDPWRALSNGVLYRLPQDGAEVQRNELALPGLPVRQLRLRVDARGGGIGQRPPHAEFALRATQLVFLARGEAPYQLAAGRRDGHSAAMPITTLIPAFTPPHLAALPQAQVQVQAGTVAAEVAAEQAARDVSWKRWGLWSLLLLGVALLAAMATSLVRRPARD